MTTEDRIVAEKDGSFTINVNAGEAVAYINVEERKLEWSKPTAWHTPTIAQMEKIPLYTHPAKTLTDEEIVRISETCDLNHVLGLIDFARAILKKASEK
jgi:hypothetical protein